MNGDHPLVIVAAVAAFTAAVLGVERFPEELPGWLAFLVLILGATLLVGQVVGRMLDEFAPPRSRDRFDRERDWTGLFTALGGVVGLGLYMIVATVVLIA